MFEFRRPDLISNATVKFGEVSEWLKERDWKSRVRFIRTVGSNPTLSAIDPQRH